MSHSTQGSHLEDDEVADAVNGRAMALAVVAWEEEDDDMSTLVVEVVIFTACTRRCARVSAVVNRKQPFC